MSSRTVPRRQRSRTPPQRPPPEQQIVLAFSSPISAE